MVDDDLSEPMYRLYTLEHPLSQMRRIWITEQL